MYWSRALHGTSAAHKEAVRDSRMESSLIRTNTRAEMFGKQVMLPFCYLPNRWGTMTYGLGSALAIQTLPVISPRLKISFCGATERPMAPTSPSARSDRLAE